MPDFFHTREVAIAGIGGGLCNRLSWNDGSTIAEARVVVLMAMHNDAATVSISLLSALRQETTVPFAVVLLNDGSEDNWTEAIRDFLSDKRVILADCRAGSAWKIRNLALAVARESFPSVEWICRLDADDRFSDRSVIDSTIRAIEDRKPAALWALGGNRLLENGKLLQRRNVPTADLLVPDKLLERLSGMVEGRPECELPSCNLWINRRFSICYPEIASGEDHWLLTHVILLHPDHGLLLDDVLHVDYSLSGQVTRGNRRSDAFIRSRIRLRQSAEYWLGAPHGHDSSICLGWGNEGMVWLENGTVTKTFFPNTVSDDHAEWLGNIPKHDFLPAARWRKDGGRWRASYAYMNSDVCGGVSIRSLSEFIGFCLGNRIVCLNVARKNFRTVEGKLLFVDIGRDIRPFEIRYFRDMCARLYLLFVRALDDTGLPEITARIRNSESELAKIPGFETYYSQEVSSHFIAQGFMDKPFKTPLPERRKHPEVTLMIKACAMEAGHLQRLVGHIRKQLCGADEFAEVLLLIDTKEHGFLREYGQGDLESVLTEADSLCDRGIVDSVLLSPNSDSSAVKEVNERWFGASCGETHTTAGVPLFPQLWGFEQVGTRYLLQMDADVMIVRTEDRIVVDIT